LLCVFLLSTGAAASAAAQSFTPTGSLHVARTEHAAVLLAGGRVLVSGGVGDDGRAIAAAETFDPRRRRWARPPRTASPIRATSHMPDLPKITLVGTNS